MNKNQKKNSKGKQVRKPVSTNFAPKRLAINFDPPMLIMQYLVVDTGKLYHHKMRLDSVLRKTKVTRQDVLNYIKTKHYLYFVSGKVKDNQVLKFIDKLLLRKGLITKTQLANIQKIQATTPAQTIKQPQPVITNVKQPQDDFDYLNDQQEEEEYYEEDYQDYQDPSNFINQKKQEKVKEVSKDVKKNAFMAYCQEYEDADGQAQASWDLDMDQNDDFV